MYFDFDYWWRIVRHVWGLKEWKGRNRTLVRLLLWIPVRTVLHSVCFMLDYILFPALWRQEVRQPVFIVGHARSGTTLMHRLMSADGDKFSYFLYWETFFPSLLQKKVIRGLGWLDSRAFGNIIHKQLEAWDERKFGAHRDSHNMSFWTAEEDAFAMEGAFASQQLSLEIPMMEVVDFYHVDQMGTRRKRWMHHYREVVKRQLLLNGGDKIHLSKNPVMSGWVESLIETFPGARIVVMMRNAEECIPSCQKLVQSSWRAKGWSKEECEKSLNLLADISFETFHHPKQVLAKRADTPHYIVDYKKLTSEPRETVLAVYEALGLEMSEDFDSWLKAQAEREKKHNSKFEYSLGEFRLSSEEIHGHLAEFYEEFGWQVPEADPGEAEPSSAPAGA